MTAFTYASMPSLSSLRWMKVLPSFFANKPRRRLIFAGGTLIGFGIASRVLSAGGAPVRLAALGALLGLPGFAAIILSSALIGPSLFVLGTFAIGLGAGLFGHGTLTATIRNAPAEQIGLSLGAWGAVQATCAGIGVALAGVVRDVLVGLPAFAGLQVQTPYNVVFMIEIAFLALAILVAIPLAARRARPVAAPTPNTPEHNTVEVI